MMSSSGLSYDGWVVQGMIDLLSSATLSTRKVVLGKGVPYYRYALKNTAQSSPGRQFFIDQGTLQTGYAWGAMHYLTLRDRKWSGMEKITQYQRLIRIGTPREEAFKEVFGVTSAKMDVLMQKYLAKDKFKTVKLAPLKKIPDSKILVKRAEPGQWELGQARLVTQQNPLDRDLAQKVRTDDKPPSGRWICPVMKAAESESRKAASCAT